MQQDICKETAEIAKPLGKGEGGAPVNSEREWRHDACASLPTTDARANQPTTLHSAPTAPSTFQIQNYNYCVRDFFSK